MELTKERKIRNAEIDSKISIPLGFYFHRYEINYKVVKSFRLNQNPYELASIFRGALHATTTQLYCNSRNDSGIPCAGCRCLYRHMFAPKAPSTHIHAAKFNNAPVPYIIEAYPSSDYYEEGDHIRFVLTLFGSANDAITDIVQLCKHAESRFPKYHPYSTKLEWVKEIAPSVDNVNNQDQYLYHRGMIIPTALRHRLSPSMISPRQHEKTNGDISITFRRLTTIRSRGSIIYNPSFDLVAQRVWERLWLLNSFYGDRHYPSSDPNWTQMFSRLPVGIPQRLRIDQWSKIKSTRNDRSRQPRREMISGITGSILYQEVELSEYLDLLLLGQYLGIGKLTPFGLGMYSLTVK